MLCFVYRYIIWFIDGEPHTCYDKKQTKTKTDYMYKYNYDLKE